jgi:large subunit ribosomal protein L1
MKKRSKRYRKAAERVEASKRYAVREALEVLRETEAAGFDETVEIALKLGVDPKKPDQIIRGAFSLPNGSGKEVRVIAFAEGEKAAEAEAAGAMEVGGQDLVKKIQDGWLDFDVAIAHPSMMRFVGKLGRILGTKGKMPSPKSGTVADDIGRAVSEFKAGKIEYRTDSAGNLHAPMGKRHFELDRLVENVEAFMAHVEGLRPTSLKGTYVQRVHLSTTMGPSVPLRV